MTTTRRDILTGLAAAGLATTALPATAQTPALKDLAAAKGLRFGDAIGTRAFDDSKVRDLLIRECNILVMENELKMYVTHNNNAHDYDFGPADKLLAFAETNKIAMRGHNMVWARDEFTPQWLKAYDFGATPKVEAERLLRDYIAVVATRYGNRLTSWDVVNEAVNPETGHIRVNVFTKILGVDALRICYEAAREHLPTMQLVYNDYMSWEAGNENHRDGVINLLNWFRKNNVPVDALGVQSHIGTGFDLGSGQVDQWKAFLDDSTGMGYDLLVTEFDVNDQRVVGDIATRDAKSAAVARTYLDQILSYKQTKDVLFWGMPDQYNWLQEFTPRDDKQPLRPTPFDADFKPKPLYDAIAAAFKAAPQR